MSDEVSSRFAATLVIYEGGSSSGVVARPSAASVPCFAVGRLLSLKRRLPKPKAVIGTLTAIWDYQNRLQMRLLGDHYLLKFSRADECRHVLHSGCGGPPDLTKVERISLVPDRSHEVSGRIATGLVSALNPNSRFGKGLGFDFSVNRINQFSSTALINPFQRIGSLSSGSSSMQTVGQPGVTFSLPGVSVTDLVVQLARFKSIPSIVEAVIPPLAFPPVIQIPSSVLEPILGVKRDADLTLVPLGKKARNTYEPRKVIPYEPSFMLEMFLAFEDGKIKVSPAKKKKVDKLLGSKNKKRVVDVRPWKLGVIADGPKKAKKRRFGARRNLQLGESSRGSGSSSGGVEFDMTSDVVLSEALDDAYDSVLQSEEAPFARTVSHSLSLELSLSRNRHRRHCFGNLSHTSQSCSPAGRHSDLIAID
ncbi:hypothetical protein ACLB2K_021902 [Fragaria x ananassa]